MKIILLVRKDGFMEILKRIALILVIIGALNWLLVGLFNVDIVATLFGSVENIMAKIVYILIGISGLISITYFFDPDD